MIDLRGAMREAAAPPDPTPMGLDEVLARGARLTRRRWAVRAAVPVAAVAVLIAVSLPGAPSRVRMVDNGPAAEGGEGVGAAGDTGLPDPVVPPAAGRGHSARRSAPVTLPTTRVTLQPHQPYDPGTVPANDSRLAFLRDGDVYTMDADGTDVRRLTTAGSHMGRISWSPDGGRLLVGRTINTSLRGRDRDVYVVDLAAGTETRLTSMGDAMHPTWSPDGMHVMFVRAESDAAGITSQGVAWMMNADGTGARRVPGISAWGDWSPDGRRFAGACGDRRLCILDVASGSITPVAGAPEHPYAQVRWSADGAWLAATDFYWGTVIVLRPDGTGARTHTLDAAVPGLDWSPDGSFLVLNVLPRSNCVGSGCTDGYGLWRVNADFTGLARIPGNQSDSEPAVRR